MNSLLLYRQNFCRFQSVKDSKLVIFADSTSQSEQEDSENCATESDSSTVTSSLEPSNKNLSEAESNMNLGDI